MIYSIRLGRWTTQLKQLFYYLYLEQLLYLLADVVTLILWQIKNKRAWSWKTKGSNSLRSSTSNAEKIDGLLAYKGNNPTSNWTSEIKTKPTIGNLVFDIYVWYEINEKLNIENKESEMTYT